MRAGFIRAARFCIFYCYILVDIRTLSSFSLILKNLFAVTSI